MKHGCTKTDWNKSASLRHISHNFTHLVAYISYLKASWKRLLHSLSFPSRQWSLKIREGATGFAQPTNDHTGKNSPREFRDNTSTATLMENITRLQKQNEIWQRVCTHTVLLVTWAFILDCIWHQQGTVKRHCGKCEKWAFAHSWKGTSYRKWLMELPGYQFYRVPRCLAAESSECLIKVFYVKNKKK